MTSHINWDDKVFYKRIVDQVEEIGLDRMKAQPSTMSEADFFAGALAVLTALGMTPIQYPSSWALGLMFGKSPLLQRVERAQLAHSEDRRAAQDEQPEPGSEV